MPEAQIEISDTLASTGYKRAMAYRAIVQIGAQYGREAAVIWVVVSIADAIAGAEHLITYHLAFLIAVGLVATATRYYQWKKEVAQMKGWSFHARLDEDGVTINYTLPQEQRYGWNFYKNYVEYDSYLQIEDESGGFSFVPKTPELFELIELTKRKIPEK